MAQFEPYGNQINQLSVSLAYVAAEKRSGIFHPEKYFREHPISFPFLLDEDRSVTKAYGVYHWLAKDAINIARPATFVVGTDGIIRYIHVGSHQRDFAPVEDLLHAARNAS